MTARTRTAEFEQVMTAAHEFADLSGNAILKHFRKRQPVENKAEAGGFDPVTAADRAAERAIARAIRRRFPDHGIVGEEYGARPGSSPFVWIIDPIDGTRAFIMGSPLWGTLIGVSKREEPYFGLMDQPFLRERIWTGPGASFERTRGGAVKRLKTRRCSALKDAILTSTDPDLFEGTERRKTLAALKSQVAMTRYGGDCYSYGLLAAGYVDIIVESGLKPYDVAALIPIIERAGGRMSTWDGQSATRGGDIVAVGDPRLHEAALRAIARV